MVDEMEEPSNPNPERSEKGHWKKGTKSPNPAGAPKSPGRKRIIELARSHSEEMLMLLVKIARFSESEREQISAAKAVLERAYGRPRQEIDLSSKGGSIAPRITVTVQSHNHNIREGEQAIELPSGGAVIKRARKIGGAESDALPKAMGNVLNGSH